MSGKKAIAGAVGCEYVVITTREAEMIARLVRIGNSRGIRLPKAVIDELGLEDPVEMELRAGELVIRKQEKPRSGWEQAAKSLAARPAESRLEEPEETRFDREEWQW